MSDSDSEEEIMVVVEFDHAVPMPTDGSKFKVLGLDTEKPIVQYQKQVFRGEWSDTVGTKVLFKEKPAPETRDPVFSAETKRLYDYAHKTTKVLKLQPYVLNQTDESIDASTAKQDTNSEIEQEEDTDAKIINC